MGRSGKRKRKISEQTSYNSLSRSRQEQVSASQQAANPSAGVVEPVSAWGADLDQAQERYNAERQYWLDRPAEIIAVEKEMHDMTTRAVQGALEKITQGFEYASHSREHWLHYAPDQRGHKPTGNAVPWLEVAETVVGTAIHNQLQNMFSGHTLGLPYGSDVRWAYGNRFLHLDVKATGPNDNPDEVVVSPNQMSGSGQAEVLEGQLRVLNDPIEFSGTKDKTRRYSYQPQLPPFYPAYPEAGFSEPLLTVTSFLKVNYDVSGFGQQGLRSIEISTVPNGLLAAHRDLPALMRRGKDDQKSRKQRVRIRLDQLVEADYWRSTKMSADNGWRAENRPSK